MHYFTLPPDSLAYWLQFQLLLTFALHPHCSSAFPVSSFCSLFSQLLLFQPNSFLIGLHVFSLPVCVCLGALGEHWQSSFWWWLKVNLHHWCTHSLTHSVTHISRCIIVSFRLPWCRSPGSQLHSFTPFSHFSLSLPFPGIASRLCRLFLEHFLKHSLPLVYIKASARCRRLL